MPEIHFKNLRLDIWEDEKGEKITSRPLTPEEVERVRLTIQDLLFGDHAMDYDVWPELYEELAPNEERWGEVNWDEEIVT